MTVRPLKHCALFFPGHNVHWIQALRSANDPAIQAKTRLGNLIEVGDHTVTVDFGGRRETFGNHDTARLLSIAGRLPRGVTINDDYAILRFGSFCFSISRVGFRQHACR